MQKNKAPIKAVTKVEILDTLDCSGFSQEIRDHYKSHVLPLIQKVVPNGEGISFAFLSDPQVLEIRRAIK